LYEYLISKTTKKKSTKYTKEIPFKNIDYRALAHHEHIYFESYYTVNNYFYYLKAILTIYKSKNLFFIIIMIIIIRIFPYYYNF